MINQPKALKILIATGTAETFAYFTLQAILIFYLTKALSFSDNMAFIISSQFFALAWLSPIAGGWIADRLLGYRIAICLGGLILSVGYALLGLGQNMLYSGLSLIIIGQGLFKSNIASFVGIFYSQDDTRREAGFTLFYMGMNIGSLLAIASVGYYQQYFGWGACFTAASCALILGIGVFVWGSRYFNGKGWSANPQFSISQLSLGLKICIVLLSFGVVFFFVYHALKSAAWNYSVYAIALLFCLYIAIIAKKLNSNKRRHLLALMILLVIAIFYKAIFFETYLVFNLFTDRLVDHAILGHQIPATVYLSLSSLFFILLAPIFAYIRQSNKVKISIPIQFALSFLMVGAGIQMLATWLAVDANNTLPSLSIILFQFIFTISQLFILPLGLSMVSEYSPNNLRGMMMGAWYLTAALGGKLAGLFADYADIPKIKMNLYDMKPIYQLAFQKYAALTFILFIICLILAPKINHLLKKDGIIQTDKKLIGET